MFLVRAPSTSAISRSNVRQFKCDRERETTRNLFYGTERSLISVASPLTCFKRSRQTQRMLTCNASTNSNTRQHLSVRLASPEKKQVLSKRINNRFFTSTTKKIHSPRKGTRKKKTLSSSSKKLTTKDRLRLSVRPSSVRKNSQQNEFGIEDMMIKSPEELVERLNSGLDIARTAVREGYATLRNPKNLDNKLDNHLLSARPGFSGITEGSKQIERKGLVMDVNWWFWNLLFAGSPAVLVALYCQFIVIPEMKLRNEESEKGAVSEGKKEAISSDSESKMSPIRKRQEQQKQQELKLRVEDITTKNSSSSTLWNRKDELYEALISWLLGHPSSTIEHDNSRLNKKDEVEKLMTETKTDTNQKQEGHEEISLEMQQQALKELELQLQNLQHAINRQKKEYSESIRAGDGDDVTSENSTKRNSFLSTITNRLKSTTSAGMNMGKERWSSLLDWWQTNRDYHQPSDAESEDSGTDDGGDGRTVARYIDSKGKIEKP